MTEDCLFQRAKLAEESERQPTVLPCGAYIMSSKLDDCYSSHGKATEEITKILLNILVELFVFIDILTNHTLQRIFKSHFLKFQKPGLDKSYRF